MYRNFVYNAKPQTPKSLGPTNFKKFWGPKLFGVCGLALYTKDGEIALWSATNGSIPCFLVLPGSESRFTEITEFIYFSLI